ncbi:MAG: hypothetical protein HUU15_19565, partial [Candidatus Brocadiae bacterium]|nr:hypothetical protein [Candidatus Brocadiia bacterium]
PGASPHGAHRPPAPAPSGGNPGVIVGAVIVVLALLAGGALLMNNSKGDPSKGSAWRQTLERGEELYRKADYPAAAEELRKIPSGAKEYRNAQTILADIAQKKKADDEAREIVAAQAAWGPIRDRFRRYEDNELPTADEEELREQLRSFIRNHPKAFELARAREYYQKMGGKPEDVGGTGTGEDKLAKEAEARWAVLQQRVAMNERGELPQEEQDRLTAELRNFITLYYRFPEAAEAQRVLRGLGREVPPVNGTETPPPGGDPKNFAELVRLVDGLVANNSWGEAVALLDAWVKKDVTGPDAGPADDKIREVRKGADNWYLGQEAEADSLAQAGKFAEAKAILLDAVGRLGEKWFFENTAAARKKITGLEKAMGGGK